MADDADSGATGAKEVLLVCGVDDDDASWVLVIDLVAAVVAIHLPEIWKRPSVRYCRRRR